MSRLSQVLTAGQMQAVEQALLDRGATVETLMERAGTGAADWVSRLSAGRPVTVLCGPGNNGGDGYVIARSLQARGVAVNVVAPLQPSTDAARAARAAWGADPVDTARGHVLVDCLFGTGLSRPLSDELRALVADLADSHDKLVAVDLPSGVDSDSGGSFGASLPQYDLTIALGAWKPAHWLMPASGRMGERRLVDIGVAEVDGSGRLAERPRLDNPEDDAHKYSRGMVVVVGGKMPGAAVLAACAAQHGGSGYVKLASEHSHPALPADIVHDDALLDEILGDERIGAVLVGPGLGRDDRARQTLVTLLAANLPTVLDADALMLLHGSTCIDKLQGALATPHEGELVQICEAFSIHAGGKVERALALHQATGMAVLAKGPDNVLVDEKGALHFFPPASSWLSTAGSGDVLAGLAASRMAMGSSAGEAAIDAVALHSEAARRAQPAFSAADLVDAIPDAYREFL